MLTWFTNLWHWISRLWKRTPHPFEPILHMPTLDMVAPVQPSLESLAPFEPRKPLDMEPPRKHRSSIAYQRRQEKRHLAHITKKSPLPNA